MISATRKRFLIGAGVIGATTLFTPFIARAKKVTIIKLGLDQELHTPITDHLAIASKKIGDATDGEVDLKIFANNELGNDTNIISGVRSGAIDMIASPDVIFATLVRSAGIDGMGFAFKDAKTAFAAVDGAVGDIVRADIVKHGLQPMHAIWDNGFREITTSTKPIKTPEDLRHFKIRVPESSISLSLFQDLGAAPVTMNESELYTALQTRVVDGQENPLTNIETQKYYQVQKYCSLTNHMWSGYWLLMNGAFWKKLPKDHQDAIESIMDAQGLEERIAFENGDATLQTKLTSQGMTFNAPDRAPFQALLAKSGFYDHWKKQFGSALWSALEKYTGTLV